MRRVERPLARAVLERVNPQGGDRAHLWSVVENRGEVSNADVLHTFDLVETEHLTDLRDRLVIGWTAPRA